MVHLDYRDARPIYTQIIDGIKEQITTGVLMPGDKLPSVREMAGMLTINPNTIQRAYRLLEFNGWIVTIPGKGCFVCDNEAQIGQEVERWYTAFDEATASLIALGVSREQMIERIKRGGSEHA
jgi:GntR family transcriptional regulator